MEALHSVFADQFFDVLPITAEVIVSLGDFTQPIDHYVFWHPLAYDGIGQRCRCFRENCELGFLGCQGDAALGVA